MGYPDGGKLADFKLATPNKKSAVERLYIKMPGFD